MLNQRNVKHSLLITAGISLCLPSGKIFYTTLYCNRSLYSTIIKDSTFKVQYVVGTLNSKAIQYYYQQKFKAEIELFPKIRIKQAKQLPILVASLAEQQLIITLVEQIRTYKKLTPNKSIEKLEREIDKIVYQLYDLTDAEIKIIEQSI